MLDRRGPKRSDSEFIKSKLEAPGEAGMAVQKMIDGVYRSADAGKEVKIG
jgi:hypothetical protein